MISIQDLKKQLKQGERPAVITIVGTEEAILDEARRELAAMIPVEQQAMNFGRYDMRQVPVDVALDDASSMPFFGDYREVVLDAPYFLTAEKGNDKVAHDIEALIAYLQQPSPTTLFVIIAPYEKLDERKRLTKALKKVSVMVDAHPLDERHAKQAITQLLAAKKVTITPDALEAFIRRTNGQYSLMVAEVQKLLTYASDGQPLTQSAITALVPRQLSDRVFDLVADVVSREATKALALYRDLLAQQEEPIRLNALMISQFRLLIQVKILSEKGYSQGDIGQTLKVHPYRIKLALKTVQRRTFSGLSAAYQGLVQTEMAMKTGQVDKSLAFELFMLRYTASA